MCGLKARSKTGYTFFIHLTFCVYLLIGSLVYFIIETPSYYHLNPQPITINSTFCQRLVDAVKTNFGYNASISAEKGNDLLGYWTTIFKRTCDDLTFGNTNSSSDAIDPSWEYSSALFLCMSLLTTIGYGNFSPKTDGGKVFVIFYGFIGIPICGLCFAATSNYFSNAFLRLYEQHPKFQEKSRHSIFIASIVFLLPGLAVFYLIPSAIFVAIEGWDYLDATYFGFITLSTIGLGDIVPALETGKNWLWFYRICWIIWVSLGIAYWAIIIGFITKALKSNELKLRWRRTSDAITKQAMEMRRAMEHISLHSHHSQKDQERFVALKSKSVFDFAFQLGTSLSSLNPGCENQSQIDLSATALGQQHRLSQDPSFVENAETFTSDEHFTRPTLANCHSSSTDSGFDDAEIVQDRPIETNTSKPSRIRGFSFTKSTKSRTSSVSSVASVKRPDVTAGKERHLPTVSENVSSIENQVYFYQPDMIWQSTFGVLKDTWAWGVVSSLGNNVRKVLDWGTPRFLSRRNQRNATPSPSSPEINPSPPGIASSQHLQNLFIEAMLILQEAEVEGFSPADETSL